MGFKASKYFLKYHIRKNIRLFDTRKKLYGFDNANTLIRTFDKRTVIKILQKYGANIGSNCDIETGLTFHNCNDYSNLIIGDNVHIGKNCFFDLSDKVKIDNNSTISMNCTFITHIDYGKARDRKAYPIRTGKINIGEKVYLGASCTVLMDINIGDNCIIGAMSLIKNDIGSNKMAAGIPAKYIKDI